MKINTNIKQIFVYGFGLLSIKFISLIMLPIITRFLNPGDFGTLEILQTFTSLLSIIFSCGIVEALFRFGGTEKTQELRERIYSNAISLALFMSILLAIFLIVFANQLSKLLPGNITVLQICFLSFAMISNTVLGVQLSWLRMMHEARAYVYFSVFFTILLASLVLLALYLGYGVTGIMFATAVANFLLCLFISMFYIKLKLLFDLESQKKLFFYGFPLIFGGLAEFLILCLANFWLPYVINLSEFALFALAMKFAALTGVFLSPISLWWFPNRFKQVESVTGRAQCARVTEAGIVLGGVFALLIALSASVFIKLFINDSYQHAIVYLPAACSVFAIKNAGDLMNTGIFLNKTSYVMIVNCLTALLTVIGFYFFMPYWHVWGVLMVLNIVFSFRWFCLGFLSQKEIFLPYRYLRLSLFIVIISGCFVLVQWMSSISDYILKGGLLSLLLVLYGFSIKLLPSLFIKKIE